MANNRVCYRVHYSTKDGYGVRIASKSILVVSDSFAEAEELVLNDTPYLFDRIYQITREGIVRVNRG